MADLAPILKTMSRLTQISGPLITRYFRRPMEFEEKQDQSPVTVADREAEAAIRKVLEEEYPDCGILGEEYGHSRPDAERQWILDPIDGTKSFISGTPLFGTLIGYLEAGVPLAGAMHLPVLGELLLGTDESCTLNGIPVRVRSCEHLSRATLLTTSVRSIEQHKDPIAFHSLVQRVKLFRGWGDCFGYYLLATGYADIMVDPIVNAWDIQPLIPIVRGAGGKITDYEGGDPVQADSAVATAGAIHQEVIEMLRG
ncbi:MAG: histidinol-phosphatase [Candidatus Omnitrophica bacterium]|nr:histidinol-phosphatase [Candidatus Omnitrophota bacterium]